MLEKRENEYITGKNPEEPFEERIISNSNDTKLDQQSNQNLSRDTAYKPKSTYEKNGGKYFASILFTILIIGLATEAKFLLTIGLAYIALMIISGILSIFSKFHRASFWDWFILRDLIKLLIYILDIIVDLFSSVFDI